MSILTKALVVLVTVLSIVLVALVVPFVATQDNLKEQVAQTETQLAQARQAAEAAEANWQLAQQSESQRNALLNQTVGKLQAQIKELEGQKATAQANERALRDQLQGLDASLTSLSSTMEEQKRMISLLTEQVETSQSKVVDQGTKMLEMADRLDEVTTERDGLVRQVRQLQEESVALTGELEGLQTTLAQVPAEYLPQGTGDAQAAGPVPDPPIAGQVVAIQQVDDDLYLVQINVGETDRVAEGMEFLVHEGEEFKGKLVINRVEPRVAVGRMTLLQETPQAGDQVYAGGY